MEMESSALKSYLVKNNQRLLLWRDRSILMFRSLLIILSLRKMVGCRLSVDGPVQAVTSIKTTVRPAAEHPQTLFLQASAVLGRA